MTANSPEFPVEPEPNSVSPIPPEAARERWNLQLEAAARDPELILSPEEYQELERLAEQLHLAIPEDLQARQSRPGEQPLS